MQDVAISLPDVKHAQGKHGHLKRQLAVNIVIASALWCLPSYSEKPYSRLLHLPEDQEVLWKLNYFEHGVFSGAGQKLSKPYPGTCSKAGTTKKPHHFGLQKQADPDGGKGKVCSLTASCLACIFNGSFSFSWGRHLDNMPMQLYLACNESWVSSQPILRGPSKPPAVVE